MTPEQFDEYAAFVLAHHEAVLTESNEDNEFDVPDPIFFLGKFDPDTGPEICVFNDPTVFEDIDEADAHTVTNFFKKCLSQITEPEVRKTLASVILSSGWTSKKGDSPDAPRTETLLLSIEDADRNTACWHWEMDRSEEGPVKFTLRHHAIVHNEPYNEHGRMQNMFDLPPLNEVQELN